MSSLKIVPHRTRARGIGRSWTLLCLLSAGTVTAQTSVPVPSAGSIGRDLPAKPADGVMTAPVSDNPEATA
ncbi:MAG: hypothetical protein JSS02_34065, partial [Planctomycetes bacterium]|nr:hypothetical protein [Planctomycetota bacterium]